MFNVGDKVRRINPVQDCNRFAGYMCMGNIYTVTHAGIDRIVLKDCPTPDFTWSIQNFELVQAAAKPHVHAEVIKAWADGAKIQFHTGKKDDTWEDASAPIWIVKYQYRIKPEPKPDVVMTRYMHHKCDYLLACLKPQPDCDRNEVKYTFDGETGKLKAVELIK